MKGNIDLFHNQIHEKNNNMSVQGFEWPPLQLKYHGTQGLCKLVFNKSASGILHLGFTVTAGEIGMCPDMALKSTQSLFFPLFVHLFRT